MKVAGIVLAGGESRRYGRPKAFAVHNGNHFYKLACAVLKPYVDEMVIVAHPRLKNCFEDCRVILDEPSFRGKGPLAGFHSAMKHISSDWYCMMACDMPWMDAETVEHLVKTAIESDQFDAIVPKVDGRLQPLAAMYHRRTFDVLESLLARDVRKVQAFLDEIKVGYVHGLNPVCFHNVNTQEDRATRFEKQGGRERR